MVTHQGGVEYAQQQQQLDSLMEEILLFYLAPRRHVLALQAQCVRRNFMFRALVENKNSPKGLKPREANPSNCIDPRVTAR
jgi:hypothetical protein